mgnify:CR=1 FL=1
MVYQVFSSEVQRGFGTLQFDVAKEVTRYIREKFPEVQVELLASGSGRGNRLLTVYKFDSMGEAETVLPRILADEGVKAILEKIWKAEADMLS